MDKVRALVNQLEALRADSCLEGRVANYILSMAFVVIEALEGMT